MLPLLAHSRLFSLIARCLIGEIDEAIDNSTDLSTIRADPIPPIRYGWANRTILNQKTSLHNPLPARAQGVHDWSGNLVDCKEIKNSISNLWHHCFAAFNLQIPSWQFYFFLVVIRQVRHALSLLLLRRLSRTTLASVKVWLSVCTVQ